MLAEAADASQRPWLHSKINYISYLAAKLNSELESRNLVDDTAGLEILAGDIPKLLSKRTLRLWIDGFSRFTAGELSVIRALVQGSRQTTIALLMNPSDLSPSGKNKDNPRDRIDTSPLGYPLATYFALDSMASAFKIEREYLNLERKTWRFAEAPELNALEIGIRQGRKSPNNLPRQKLPGSQIRDFRLVAVPTSSAEIRFVAREIRRLVCSGVRYKDISVVSRSLEPYRRLISDCFPKYDIPFFLDCPRPLAVRPALRLFSDLLDFAVEPDRRSMLSLLRNPHSGVPLESTDRLENLLLRFAVPNEGICEHSVKLVGEFEPAHETHLAAFLISLGEYGSRITRPLTAPEFEYEMQGIVKMLFPGIEERVRGDIIELEAYNLAVRTLHEIGVLCGDEKMSVRMFSELFEAAVSDAKAKIPPPALDEVIVSEIERGRQESPKHVFLLGLIDERFPLKGGDGGLITQEEKLYLRQQGFPLEGDGVSRFIMERYLFYVACTRASNSLTVTIPIRESSEAVPSPLLSMLPDWAAGRIEENDVPETPRNLSEAVTPIEFASYLQSKGMQRELLVPSNGEVRLAETLNLQAPPAAAKLHKWGTALRVKYCNRISPTRLEKYSACPFAYFAEADLRLFNRPEGRPDSLSLGAIYHAILEKTLTESLTRKLCWRGGDQSALLALMDEAATYVLNDASCDWSRIPAFKLLQDQIKRDVKKTFLIILQTLNAGLFDPLLAEQWLGNQEGALPQVKIEVDDVRFLVSGRIDRIDLEANSGCLAVVDYKSGLKKISWDKLFHGLDIQLLFYGYALEMLAGNIVQAIGVADNPPRPKVGALLWFHISPDIYSRPTFEDAGEDKGIMRKSRGLISEHAARLLDKSATGWSKYYSIYFNKNGGFGYQNKIDVIGAGDWKTLFDWFTAYLRRILSEIAEGRIAVAPVKVGNYCLCDYCNYASVCRMNPSHDIVRLAGKAGDKESVISLMKRELEGVQ
ncbi:MAG: PD-(D/E)XK nuclease family protein [bacterium]